MNEAPAIPIQAPPAATSALLVDADAGATMLGISRRHFWALHSSGRLGPLPIKLGKRTMWVRAELERWTAARCPSREEWLRAEEN